MHSAPDHVSECPSGVAPVEGAATLAHLAVAGEKSLVAAGPAQRRVPPSGGNGIAPAPGAGGTTELVAERVAARHW